MKSQTVDKVVMNGEPTEQQLASLVKYIQEGQLEAAVKTANQLLLLFPTSANLHNLLGAALAELKGV